jgi:hypothetical protein
MGPRRSAHSLYSLPERYNVSLANKEERVTAYPGKGVIAG